MAKFVASYSGGKDSILSIYRAICQGMEPIALIITYNIDKKRSWFHGIPEKVLDSVSKSLNIPIWLIKTSGKEYTYNFEKILKVAKDKGADFCVFGDIDIEGHLDWCSERCENAGIKAYFPLWKEDRKSIVYEFIESGFKANLTVIDTSRMDEKYLGKVLTKELAEDMQKEGVDICGENGEYHTFVSEGPLFKSKVEFSFGKKLISDNHVVLPIFEI